MTDATVSAQAGVKTTGGAFYRLVWKWHFLASLYVLPSYEAQIAAIDATVGVKRVRGITNYDDPTRSTVIEFDDADKTRSARNSSSLRPIGPS